MQPSSMWQAFFLGGPIDGTVKEYGGDPRPITAHKVPAIQIPNAVAKDAKSQMATFEVMVYYPVPFTLTQEDGQNLTFIVMTAERVWSGCEIFQRMINHYKPGDGDGTKQEEPGYGEVPGGTKREKYRH